jgi:hypothetical protein
MIKKIDTTKIVPITNVLLGSDPEFFALDKDGNPKSLVGLVGGTKKKPIWLEDMLGYQEDNVAAEFNIIPSNNSEDFYSSFLRVFNYIQKEKLDKHNLKFCFESALYFDELELQTEQAAEFGCSPDFNCWSLKVNEMVNSSTNLRSAGGHLTVGYSNPNEITNIAILRGLELHIGIPSIFLDEGHLRKQLYGKSGAFRHTKFGVECRTFSNFWYKDFSICNYIFQQAFKVIDDINNGVVFDDESDMEACITAINNNDKDIAKYLIDKYEINTVVKQVEKINV